MYWSPIRTRLLVGMLTPAIRAKAVTPFADFCVADFCVADFCVVRLPYPPGMRGGVGKGQVPIVHCRTVPTRSAPKGGGMGCRRIQHHALPRISTSATRPSTQGLASLKNSLTGCGVFTVSIAIRQPLRPRFFAPGPLFPPGGRSGLVGALPPRLTTTFIPALALVLPRLATAGVAGALAALVSALALGLVSDLTADLASDLAPTLPRTAAAGLTAPGRAVSTGGRAGLRA